MLSLLLTKDAVKKVTAGDPWIFAGMIEMTSELQMADSGVLVNICDHRARPIGVGYFNPKSQIACRILSLQPNTQINQRFFANLFNLALSKRKSFTHPYYRLAHSESDFLPGLVIDRFGDTLVCQTTTAGMENLKPVWIPALQEVLDCRNILLKDDVPIRKKEGLAEQVIVHCGDVPDLVEVKEHDCIYFANLLTGQKTGWFYDQRANRNYFGGLVKGKNILDIYSHSGGFGIAAAKGGAAKVTIVDSSALALDLAQKAALRNGVDKVCETVRSDAYEYLEKCVAEGKKFDAIMADPPAFIKERKYTAAGLKGYGKLAFLCASALGKDGLFCIASCSHHAAARDFRKAVEQGIAKAGRSFELIHKAGADKDHPVHSALEESQYLKFMAFIVN